MRRETEFWTEEEKEMLRVLWTEGLSASEIAQRMYDLSRQRRTRNAVIGKARRMQLSARKSPIVIDPNSPRKLRTGSNYARLLTHPNEDLLRWDSDEQ